MKCKLCNKEIMVSEGESFSLMDGCTYHTDCYTYLKGQLYNKPLEEKWQGMNVVEKQIL